MKIVTAKITEPAFKPVSFSIVCETQLELDTWRALFNHFPFTNLIGLSADGYEKMDSLGADKKAAEAIWREKIHGVTFPKS